MRTGRVFSTGRSAGHSTGRPAVRVEESREDKKKDRSTPFSPHDHVPQRRASGSYGKGLG